MDGLVLDISCNRGCRVAICAKYVLANVSIPATFRTLFRCALVNISVPFVRWVLFHFDPVISSTIGASAGGSCLVIKSFISCNVSHVGVLSSVSPVPGNLYMYIRAFARAD